WNLIKIRKLVDNPEGLAALDIAMPGDSTLGKKNDFKLWMAEQESALVKAVRADPSLGAYEKTKSGSVAEEAELTAAHVLWLLGRKKNFDHATQKMMGLIEYEMADFGVPDIRGVRATMESVLEG